MKAKLLKKLRKEIFNNSDMVLISNWSGYLTTRLKGKLYKGEIKATISFQIAAEKCGRELEHIALKGYLNDRRKQL